MSNARLERLPRIRKHPRQAERDWVSTRTRVPVSALFGILAEGATVQEFLDRFPGVEERQVRAALDTSSRHSATGLGLRILLDHNIPKPLCGCRQDRTVHTANERGWEELKTGDLMETADQAAKSLDRFHR